MGMGIASRTFIRHFYAEIPVGVRAVLLFEASRTHSLAEGPLRHDLLAGAFRPAPVRRVEFAHLYGGVFADQAALFQKLARLGRPRQ